MNLFKSVIAGALLSASSIALASPTVSVLFETDKVINKDLLVTEVSHQTKDVRLGAYVSYDANDLHKYGAYVGMPVQVGQSRLSITPAVGLTQYENFDETVATMDLGATYNISKHFALEGRARYVAPLDSKAVIDNEMVYQAGLSARF